jgi:hypothetical protein
MELSLDIDMRHGHRTQSGHGHAAWTWTCSTDLIMQHGSGQWTCMDAGMPNIMVSLVPLVTD